MLRRSRAAGLIAATATIVLVLPAGVDARPASGAAKRSASVELVSKSAAGGGANGDSFAQVIAADGHFLYFTSNATNLVRGSHDQPGTIDLFERDLSTGATTLLSRTPSGDAVGGVDSEGLATDADGRFVAYVDFNPGIAAGPSATGRRLLLFDRLSGQTITISDKLDGTPIRGKRLIPSVSGNGRYVDYARLTRTGAPTVGFYLYRYDTTTGLTTMLVDHAVGPPDTGYEDAPATSYSGRYVYYQRRSEFNASMRVAFTLYRLDTTTGGSQRIAKTGYNYDLGFGWLSTSKDGNEVAFSTTDRKLAPNDHNGDFDVFVWSASTGAFQLVSHAAGGGVADSQSALATISADGVRVCYRSTATDILGSDTTDDTDLYSFNLKHNATTLVTRNVTGSQDGSDVSGLCSISRHGGRIAFTGTDPHLTSPPSNQRFNEFVYVR